MTNEYTRVRKNGIEDDMLTHVIESMGKAKFEKLGWEILPTEPMEVQTLKRLKAEGPPEIKVEAISEDVVIKSTISPEGEPKKRAYNKKS